MKIPAKLLSAGLMPIVLAVVLASCSKSNAATADQSFNISGGFVADRAGAVSAGVTAPDFTALDVVTGEKITLSQFKGKTVLLNFVNYGCSPKINDVVSAQLLAIRQLSQSRSDFVPVSVFCGCCPVDALKQFAASNNLQWSWLLDSDNSIVASYSDYVGQYGYPTLVFIGQDQVIRDASGALSLSELAKRLDGISGASPSAAVQ